MVTQKDIHNMIVEKAEPAQKAYLAMQCGNDSEKIKSVEQSMANIVNGIVSAIGTDGFKYLNEKM